MKNYTGNAPEYRPVSRYDSTSKDKWVSDPALRDGVRIVDADGNVVSAQSWGDINNYLNMPESDAMKSMFAADQDFKQWNDHNKKVLRGMYENYANSILPDDLKYQQQPATPASSAGGPAPVTKSTQPATDPAPSQPTPVPAANNQAVIRHKMQAIEASHPWASRQALYDVDQFIRDYPREHKDKAFDINNPQPEALNGLKDHMSRSKGARWAAWLERQGVNRGGKLRWSDIVNRRPASGGEVAHAPALWRRQTWGSDALYPTVRRPSFGGSRDDLAWA